MAARMWTRSKRCGALALLALGGALTGGCSAVGGVVNTLGAAGAAVGNGLSSVGEFILTPYPEEEGDKDRGMGYRAKDSSKDQDFDLKGWR